MRAVVLVASGMVMSMPNLGMAQACLGSPAGPGQFTLGGGVSFSDGATGYAVNLGGNLQGPLAFSATGGIVDIDGASKNATVLSGTVAIDLPVENLGLCPVVGVGYMTWGDQFAGFDVDFSAVQFPAIVSVGVRAPLEGGTEIIPFGAFGLVYTRARASAAGFSETDSDTDFLGSGGVTLAFGQVYLQGGVSKVFREGSDATITIGAGFRF